MMAVCRGALSNQGYALRIVGERSERGIRRASNWVDCVYRTVAFEGYRACCGEGRLTEGNIDSPEIAVYSDVTELWRAQVVVGGRSLDDLLRYVVGDRIRACCIG